MALTDYNIKEELEIIEEYNKQLNVMCDLNCSIVNKLKEKEHFIINLTKELIDSKQEINELNKELNNLMNCYEEKNGNLKSIIEENTIIFENETRQFKEEIEELIREIGRLQQKSYENYFATTCDDNDAADFKYERVKAIDKNGNMKK